MTLSSSKLRKIEMFKVQDIANLVLELLPFLGYHPIELVRDDLILADIKQGLSIDTHAFFLTEAKLSGAVALQDYAHFQTRINTLREELNFHIVFIASPHHISSGAYSHLEELLPTYSLNKLDRDRLLELTDKYLPRYWQHDDKGLLAYERKFLELQRNDAQLKHIKMFTEKHKHLLSMFIEPPIKHLQRDVQNHGIIPKRVSLEAVAKSKKPVLLSGDAGTGKSTTLMKVGELLIQQNSDESKKKLPIYITVLDIIEAQYRIEELISKLISTNFDSDLKTLSSIYEITLLIDTIDELDDNHQINILNSLAKFHHEYSILYIIGTRNFERIKTFTSGESTEIYFIEHFSSRQIREFLLRFFTNETSRADKLLNALKENRIIDRLPLTPLALSLISILYYENEHTELPATITDIFEAFNDVLVSKAVVNSHIEFIDTSFRERILSLYALELLQRKEHKPMTRNEFIDHFKKYYADKTIPIKNGSLEDALTYLIDHSGMLVVKNAKYIQFSHGSFMEFYAAQEIFKHQRGLESQLVINFFEPSWQNAAVFYGGKSKDMPTFLQEITKKLNEATLFEEQVSGVMGIGYLLQALFQTDNKLRRDAILAALRLNLEVGEFFKKLSSDNFTFFDRLPMPVLQVINVFLFFENFNSGTLREALLLAFEDVYNEYKSNKDNYSAGYQALLLSITLHSERIGNSDPIKKLLWETEITSNAVLCNLADLSLDFFDSAEDMTELKKLTEKALRQLKPEVKDMLRGTAARLRFTSLDIIKPDRAVLLLTEGKTDAIILEHAYITLTKGRQPYWQIHPCGNESGGANTLRTTLENSKPFAASRMIVGIFDHDKTGLGGYIGLNKNTFDEKSTVLIKKHTEKDIYAVVIPIPLEMSHYNVPEQDFNVFEIEHYFGHDFLGHRKMLTATSIPNVFKIPDSMKSKLTEDVRKINDPKIFEGFIPFFRLIDSITNMRVDYHERLLLAP